MADIIYSSKIYRLLSSVEKPTGSLGDMIVETDTGHVFAKEANGWAEVITSDNLKSGSVEVLDDSYVAVAFTTAFANVPNVTVGIVDDDPDAHAAVNNVTVNSFDLHLGAGSGNKTIHWIATDADNL